MLRPSLLTALATLPLPVLAHPPRWVAVYVTGRDGWLLAVSQATRPPG